MLICTTRFFLALLIGAILLFILCVFLRREYHKNERVRKYRIYCHLESGRLFWVKYWRVVMMKNRANGEWSQCVIYEPMDEEDHLYVREIEDFLVKFKSIHEIENNPELEEYKKYID